MAALRGGLTRCQVIHTLRAGPDSTNAASCTFATSGLRLQAHAARTDQARIGRLEAPEGPADRAFEVNVLIVGAAEGKVSRQHVAVRNRYKPTMMPRGSISTMPPSRAIWAHRLP